MSRVERRNTPAFSFTMPADGGRLQDADESAYYEHICRQAGSGSITARSSSKTMEVRFEGEGQTEQSRAREI